MLIKMDPKQGATNITVTQNGPVNLPPGFVAPIDPTTNVHYGKCKNGTVFATGDGVKVPCAAYVLLGSSHWNQTFTIDASVLSSTAQNPFAPNVSALGLGTMPGAAMQFQVSPYGGATFGNGNTPATFGVNSALAFPLGNVISFAPTTGFQVINDSIVNSSGSHQTGSTFIDTSASFKKVKIGADLHFTFGRSREFEFAAGGGATVADATTTQQMGFCAGTGGSLPPGCNVLSKTTTNNWVWGPSAETSISRRLNSHLAFQSQYNWTHLKKDVTGGTGGTTTTGTQTLFDVNQNTVTGGFTFYVGDLLRR
jgi:hypothetical protein